MTKVMVDGISGDILRQYIERIERLEMEKNEIASQIKDIYAEAKSDGFEPKIMKQVIKIRKMEKAEVEELEALVEIYKRALGMDNAID